MFPLSRDAKKMQLLDDRRMKNMKIAKMCGKMKIAKMCGKWKLQKCAEKCGDADWNTSMKQRKKCGRFWTKMENINGNCAENAEKCGKIGLCEKSGNMRKYAENADRIIAPPPALRCHYVILQMWNIYIKKIRKFSKASKSCGRWKYNLYCEQNYLKSNLYQRCDIIVIAKND